MTVSLAELIAEITAASPEKGGAIVAKLNTLLEARDEQASKDRAAIEAAIKGLGNQEENLAKRIAEIAKEAASKDAKIKKLTEQLETQTSEVQRLKTDTAIGLVCQKGNANPDVVKQLLKLADPDEKLQVSDDGKTVTIAGKDPVTWARDKFPGFTKAIDVDAETNAGSDTKSEQKGTSADGKPGSLFLSNPPAPKEGGENTKDVIQRVNDRYAAAAKSFQAASNSRVTGEGA